MDIITPAELMYNLKATIRELWPKRDHWFNKAMIHSAIDNIRLHQRTYNIKVKFIGKENFVVTKMYAVKSEKDSLIDAYNKLGFETIEEEIYIDHKVV